MEKILIILLFFITNTIIHTKIIKSDRTKSPILIIIFILYISFLLNKENFQNKEIEKFENNNDKDKQNTEDMKNQPYNKQKYMIKLKDKDFLAKIYNINKFVKMQDDLGNAIKFNGEKGHMIIPNINLEIYSISFIMKRLDSSKKQVVMASIDNSIKLVLHKNKLSLTVTSMIDASHTNGIIVDKEWNHIVIVRLYGEFRLFVNGNYSKLKFNRKLRLTTLIFGSDKNKKQHFRGYIGNINILENPVMKSLICSMHDMCGKAIDINDIEKKCDFVPNGNTKKDCLDKCVTSSECGPTKCKEQCDTCDDQDMCDWLVTPKLVVPKCDYVPFGSTKLSCINKCILNENCDYMACQETCNSCSDIKLCPWIDPPPEPLKELPIEPPPVYDSKGRPSAPQIFIKPANAMVKIDWSKPYEGDAPIESYVAFLFKTMNKGEGVKMSMVPFPKCEACVHVINDLDEETTYSVGVRAYNNLGLSRMSNIMTFQPKFKLNPKPVPPPSNEPEVAYNYCNNSQKFA